jgi:hypothetical protein
MAFFVFEQDMSAITMPTSAAAATT